ncbi:MAG: 30S ribosomal protein S13 [bacterium]|nr:30S ribosomal protein S13 [bacterium]
MPRLEMVRLRGVDIPGHLPLERALTRIKGIGWNTARAVVVVAMRLLGINRFTAIGDLSDEQLKKLEEIIVNLHQYVPRWLVNRPIDPFTGEARHVTGTDLEVITKQDIDFHKKIMDYRGWRHKLGLPVRGQRTRSSFRGRKRKPR